MEPSAYVEINHRQGRGHPRAKPPHILPLHTDVTWGEYQPNADERETLEHLVAGKTKSQIADALNLSVHTVDSHIRNVYAKLEVHSRSDAVAKALRERLV